MTIAFLEMDETGVYVEGVGYSKIMPPNAIPVPAGGKPEDFARSYMVDGKLVPRPTVAVPQALEAGGYSMVEIPLGTLVMVHDLIGKEVMAEFTTTEENFTFEFDLPDAGRYRIEVEPPLPYTNSRYEIEVS